MVTFINIPTTAGVAEVPGKVCLLPIGGKKHKFFIHKAPGSTEPILSDYASGMKVGSLRPVMLRHMRSYARMTERAAAEELINDIVRQIGADKFRETIAAANRIN